MISRIGIILYFYLTVLFLHHIQSLLNYYYKNNDTVNIFILVRL